ncbi:MAG: flagellar motor protein MotB, partial [Gammaproteobacteria bacterium]|nr:flagellar motor protein MotB [Gammaproteobacteria bacterium]
MLEDHRSGPRHDSLMSAYHESDSGSGWMISYLDIMTLLVALFVVIIAAAGPVIPQWNQEDTQKDSASEYAYTSVPALEVPLPESLAQVSDERASVARWHWAGLSPVAVSAALGVAGLPKLTDFPRRRTSFGVPPLLAAPPPLAEPAITLPKLLMPAGSDDFTSPLADYMVVLTDRP